MSIKLYRLGFILSILCVSYFANGKTIHNLAAQINEDVAININKSAADNSTTLSGFYISAIFLNNNCSGTADYTPELTHNNFAMPKFTVTNSQTTIIGQATLYSTFATTYVAATLSNFPTDTTTLSIQMKAINAIDYAAGNSTTHPLATNAGLGTAQCFILTCDSSTRTCTSNATWVYY